MANTAETYQARRGALIAGFTAINDWGERNAHYDRENEGRKTVGHRLSEDMKKQMRGRSQKIVRFIAEAWGLDNAYIVDHFCVGGEVDASICAGFFLSTLLASEDSANLVAAIDEGDMSIDDLGFVVTGEDKESEDTISDEMRAFFIQHERLLTQMSCAICAFIDNGTYVDPQGVYVAVKAMVEYERLNAAGV